MTPFERLVIDNGDVQSLFDTGEIDHVCQSLSSDAISIKQGLQRCLIQPLNKVIEILYPTGPSNFLDAAMALSDCVHNIVRAIDANLNSEMAKEFSEILKNRWSDFVTNGAACRVYDELPKVSKKARANASKPRKKDPMRVKILEAMRSSQHESFDIFMSRWAIEPVEGLALRADAETANLPLEKTKYTVEDWDGELGSKPYTWGTLQKLYSS